LLHTRQRAALGIEIFDAVGILAGHAHRRMCVVAHIAYIPCSVGFIRRHFERTHDRRKPCTRTFMSVCRAHLCAKLSRVRFPGYSSYQQANVRVQKWAHADMHASSCGGERER
jgi:hypothetical protein